MRAGCAHKAKREVMERHEAECGYRDVPCIVATCPKYVKFKDYGEHIFEHHSVTKRPVWVFNRKQRRKEQRSQAPFNLENCLKFNFTLIVMKFLVPRDPTKVDLSDFPIITWTGT